MTCGRPLCGAEAFDPIGHRPLALRDQRDGRLLVLDVLHDGGVQQNRPRSTAVVVLVHQELETRLPRTDVRGHGILAQEPLGGSDLRLGATDGRLGPQDSAARPLLEELDLPELRLLHGDPLLLRLHRELREEDRAPPVTDRGSVVPVEHSDRLPVRRSHQVPR